MQLNDEQKSALDGLKQDASPEHLAAREAFRSEMDKLRDLRRKGSSQETLTIQNQAVEAARARLNEFRNEHQAQLKTILTPEQFSAFEACNGSKELRQQNRMGRKMGRGMENRGGN